MLFLFKSIQSINLLVITESINPQPAEAGEPPQLPIRRGGLGEAGAEVKAVLTRCHFVITCNKQKQRSGGRWRGWLMTPTLSLQSEEHSSVSVADPPGARRYSRRRTATKVLDVVVEFTAT